VCVGAPVCSGGNCHRKKNDAANTKLFSKWKHKTRPGGGPAREKRNSAIVDDVRTGWQKSAFRRRGIVERRGKTRREGAQLVCHLAIARRVFGKSSRGIMWTENETKSQEDSRNGERKEQ